MNPSDSTSKAAQVGRSGAAPAPNFDLTHCDREPIHIRGSIQPYGMLLSRSRAGDLQRASANAGSLLMAPVAQALGQRFEAVIRPEFSALLEQLEAALARPRWNRTLIGSATLVGQEVLYLSHESRGNSFWSSSPSLQGEPRSTMHCSRNSVS